MADALKQINEQTKDEPTRITVVDKRAAGKNANVKLAAEYPGFWQALDAVATEASAALSMYQSDGSIALVDGKPPLIQPSYHSVFRTTVKRVTMRTGFRHRQPSDAALAGVRLGAVVQAVFHGSAELQGRVFHVASRRGQGWLERARREGFRPACHRGRSGACQLRAASSNAKITSLAGEFRVIGPEKMLTVVFADLQANAKPRKQVSDGVAVTLASLTVDYAAKSWTVQIDLDYPADSPKLDSYQSASLLAYNTIALQGSNDQKRTFPAQPYPILKKLTSNSASIIYRFRGRHEKRQHSRETRQAGGLEAGLRHVPGRIVEMSVPFAFWRHSVALTQIANRRGGTWPDSTRDGCLTFRVRRW